MRKTYVETLSELSRKDERVMCVIGDTGFSVFEEYEREFGSRFVNCGIQEQNFVSFSAGLSAMGMKPFSYNCATFMCYRSFEQIELDICYNDHPVILVGVGSGNAYGTAGPTHHANMDLAMMRNLPGMNVFAPCDPTEMRAIMYYAYELRRPTYIRIGRSVDPIVHKERKLYFDKPSMVLMHEGGDAVLFATGTVVKDALDAVKKIEVEDGIHVKLYSVPFIKPFDQKPVVAAIEQGLPIFTAEEHSVIGGIGTIVQEVIASSGMAAKKLHIFSCPDSFSPVVGTRDYLDGEYGLDALSMAKKMKAMLL